MVGHRRHVQNAEETDVRERDLLDIEMDDFRRQMQELQQRLDSYENHVADVENDSENGSSSGNEDDVNPFHRIPEPEPKEQTIARYLGGLKEEVADVVQLQPYWSFNDMRKLALKVEKQQKEAKKRGFRSVAKESSSNWGSAPSYKPNTAAKSSTTKASEKNPLGPLDLVPLPTTQNFRSEAEERAKQVKKLHEQIRDKIAKQNEKYRAQANKHHLSPYYGDDGTFDSRVSLLQPGEHDMGVFSKGSKELELLEYEIMGQVKDVLDALY
ncbi:hypothetical protein MRB53_001438 [Persea americana]|uniref:Uncharacterized protein n=1 Tax=Persea americana TaxID=3435 RepID=A0ACC2MRR6_PERAE|nr:hypothetical protein MRB53_001438 [Persea americana]